MVTRMYLVRHCQSVGNGGDAFQGRYESPVSEVGQKQLELLALRFRNIPLDAVFSSPISRAYATAQAIARYRGLEITVVEDLAEIDGGEMENMSLREATRRFPEVIENWWNAMDLCAFPGGETMEQVYDRVGKAIDRLFSENQGKTVAVATHGGVLMNLYARVTYGNIRGLREGRHFGNTGVSVLEERDGVRRFLSIDDLSHLPPELRRPPSVRKDYEAEP